MKDKDKYVVYTGIEDDAATFSLYDEGGVVTQLTMSSEDVPSGTDIGDHFWVDLNEDDNIVGLQFDPEFTAQKKSEAQTAVEKYRKLQEKDRKKLNEDDDG